MAPSPSADKRGKRRSAETRAKRRGAMQPKDGLTSRLPGPAAAVQSVPETEQVLSDLSAAGLVDAQVTFLASTACFGEGESQFRETRLQAVAS